MGFRTLPCELLAAEGAAHLLAVLLDLLLVLLEARRWLVETEDLLPVPRAESDALANRLDDEDLVFLTRTGEAPFRLFD